MRNPLVLVGAAIVVASCMSGIHDGPMRQVEGHQLDQATLDGLIKGRATADEVIQTLGPPNSDARSNGSGTLVYKSVRARMSYQSILGIRHSESTQQFFENWALSFKDGHLVGAKYSSEVK